MIYIITILSILLFIFMPLDMMISYGVSIENYHYALTYPFLHASWLHLIINVLSMMILWFPIRRIYIMRYNEVPHNLHVATYISAVIAGLFCATTVPTVGMSGCVFFLLGVLLMLNPTKRQALNYLWLVATVAVQWYFGKSNTALHLFAFAEGVVYMCIREFLYQYKSSTGLFELQESADTGTIHNN